MALQVWLPLNKDVRNNGLDNSILVHTSNFSVSSDKSVVGTKSGRFSGTSPQLYLTPVANIINGKQNFSVALWAYQLKSKSQLLFAFLKSYFAFALWNNWLWVRTQATGDGTGTTYGPHKMIELPTTNINKWTHYVCTFDKGTCKVYIDGNFHGSGHTTDNDSMLTTLDKAYVGHWNGSYPFSGYIEDFRVYDNTITEEDVKRLYNCKIMDIVATNHSDGFFYDNSGLLINKLVSSTITYSGNSMYFNGSSSRIMVKDKTSGLNISGGTLSIWFTPPSEYSTNMVLFVDPNSHMAFGFSNTAQSLTVVAYKDNGVSKTKYKPTNIHKGELNNVIVSYNSESTPSYCLVNGITAETYGGSTYWSTNSGLTIGQRFYSTTRSYSGYISKVTVYRNQLNEEEAKNIYSSEINLLKDGFDLSIQIPYLEFTGTQYIELPQKQANNSIKIILDFCPDSSSQSQPTLMGIKGKTFQLFRSSSTNIGLWWKSSGSYGLGAFTPNANNILTLEFKNSTFSYNFNGTSNSYSNTELFPIVTGGNILIGGYNPGTSYPFYGKLYGIKIYLDDVLDMDLIAVTKGLYDKISKTLHFPSNGSF